MAVAAGDEVVCGDGLMSSGGKRPHLGIPEAIFVEDVDSFMKQPGNETADIVLKKLDEQYQKYKFMELNLAQKKRRLKSQIPEIKQTLEILKHMQKKKESTNLMETRFLLADNLYCKASVPPTDKVCLWLGANVMLEYDIDEAQALLEKNLSTATRNLESLEEDLDFLRDQFTTTEVSYCIDFFDTVMQIQPGLQAHFSKGKTREAFAMFHMFSSLFLGSLSGEIPNSLYRNFSTTDMARVYNWDVKRRSKDDTSKNTA